MSYYSTIEGEIVFPNLASYKSAIVTLREGGWLNENEVFVDENGTSLEDEPHCMEKHLTINIPYGYYRNMGRVLAEITKNTKGVVVETSTDGCFEGSVYTDGVFKNYNLNNWLEEVAPNPDEDFDAYCSWQSDVEDKFFDTFLEQ